MLARMVDHSRIPGDDAPKGGTGAPTRAPATIYDVAALVGVNASTVSRALNKPGRVSAATEARIRAAAEQLNFRINPMARALHTGRTQTIALVLADITNPVSFGVIRGAGRVAAAGGYTLVIAETEGSDAREREVVERLLPGTDGIILVNSRLDVGDIADFATRKPLVLTTRKVDGVPTISTDFAAGISGLFLHLVDLGHRSIAYLSGPPVPWQSERWAPLLAAAEEHPDVALVEIGPNDPTIDGGRSALRRVLASKATAVLAFNDLIAIGLMQAAAEHGVDVPGRLSVAGFDDIFGSDLIVPALTTVRVPLVETGAAATERLLASLSGEDAAHDPARLQVELVVRESTAPPAASHLR